MSIRRAILDESPFSKLIPELIPNAPSAPEAFVFAVEGHLRIISGLGALDGFTSLHVVEETSETLRIVGLTHVLPSSLLPLEVSFQVANDGISYLVLLGSDDRVWNGLTESKRWKAVYLYATEEHEPQWNWNQPLEGLLGPKLDL